LAHRARQKIENGGVSFDVAAVEHRRVTEKFIAVPPEASRATRSRSYT
jgi:hypothetical protein